MATGNAKVILFPVDERRLFASIDRASARRKMMSTTDNDDDVCYDFKTGRQVSGFGGSNVRHLLPLASRQPIMLDDTPAPLAFSTPREPESAHVDLTNLRMVDDEDWI